MMTVLARGFCDT